MENMPFVFLRKLFHMMPSLNEAIKCSQVCRSWRAAYEAIKPETLCLYQENYIPLNHRLFYSNERVSKFNFLRLHLPFIHFRFFESSAASVHFANIKKLVIFDPLDWPNLSSESRRKFRFKDQFNAFKCLEYLQIYCAILALEGCEIDLPNLKILSWGGEFEGDKQIILNTPSLEAMRIFTGPAPENYIKIVNFEFKFAQSLKHLDLMNYELDFKFDFSSFVNLECLVFSHVSHNIYEKKRQEQQRGIEGELRLFGDDFLESLPNLKLLFFDSGHSTRFDLPKLVEEKRKFNLDDLNIFNCSNFPETFDYPNWQRYLEPKMHLKYWPGEVDMVFEKLISCKVPLGLFKENYFKINELKVRQVDDQAQLVDFLRNTEIRYLSLEYDCNLRQTFFDEIADSGPSLSRLALYGWDQFNNLSVLSKLNVIDFEVHYPMFHREAVMAVMTNPVCLTFEFNLYEGLSEERRDDELRKEPEDSVLHAIRRVKNEFHCQPCGWISINDPTRSEDPMEVTLRHIEDDRYTEGNMTLEEMRKPEICLTRKRISVNSSGSFTFVRRKFKKPFTEKLPV